jgi:hypothetical protein
MVPALLLLCGLGFLWWVVTDSKHRPMALPSPRRDEDQEDELPEMLEVEPLRLLDLGLQPGTEAFTREPLLAGVRYKISFAGVFRYRATAHTPGIVRNPGALRQADACYDAGAGHNFTKAYWHSCLLFDGRPVTVDPFAQDRSEHRYDFIYRGTGHKLAVLLNPPREHVRTFGTLSVSVELLSSRDETLLAAQEAAQQAKDIRQAAARQDADRRQAEAARRSRFEELQLLYALCPHYCDDGFLHRYARKHRTELLQARDALIREFVEFQSDRAFIAYLKERGPHLIAFATWKARACTIAEKLDLDGSPRRSRRSRSRRYGRQGRRDVRDHGFAT